MEYYTFEFLRAPGAIRDAGFAVAATVVASDARRALNALEWHYGFRPADDRVRRAGVGDPDMSGIVQQVPTWTAPAAPVEPVAPKPRRPRRASQRLADALMGKRS